MGPRFAGLNGFGNNFNVLDDDRACKIEINRERYNLLRVSC
jgi:hypothetical protein